MTIDFLIKVFSENKNREAIIWNGKSYSYEWLNKNIKKYQQLIDSKKIKQGTVIALEGDFSPNSVALLLALIEKACIIVPLTNTSNKNENRLFEIAKVEFVFRVNINDVINIEKIQKIL